MSKAAGAKENTPMAICSMENIHYLFYLTTEHFLMVIECKANTWQHSRYVESTLSGGKKPDKAASNTDLSAVVEPTKKAIVLFYRQVRSENEYDSFVWQPLA